MRFCTIGIKIHYPSDEVSHAALTSKVDATLIIRDYTISFFVLWHFNTLEADVHYFYYFY